MLYAWVIFPHFFEVKLGHAPDAAQRRALLRSRSHFDLGEDVTEYIETVVVGGGQAGLSTGFYLKKLGRNFVILDANARLGDQWRRHYDSLVLFTARKYDGLPGLPFPGEPYGFPGRDEVAAYIEHYATRHADGGVHSLGCLAHRVAQWHEASRAGRPQPPVRAIPSLHRMVSLADSGAMARAHERSRAPHVERAVCPGSRRITP